jgi:hypothetical protein
MPRCCAARGTRTKPARVQETQSNLVVLLLYVCCKRASVLKRALSNGAPSAPRPFSTRPRDGAVGHTSRRGQAIMIRHSSKRRDSATYQ